MSDSSPQNSKKQAIRANLLQMGLYGSLFGLKKLIPFVATKGANTKRVLGTAAVAGILYNGFRSLRLVEAYLKNKYGDAWATAQLSEKDDQLRNLVRNSPQSVFTTPLITQTRAILNMEPLKKVAFGIPADRIRKLRQGIHITPSDLLGKAALPESSPAIQRQKQMVRRIAKLHGDTKEQADRIFAASLAHQQREKGLRTAGIVGNTLDGPVIYYNKQMLKAPASLVNKREALADLLIRKNNPIIGRSVIFKGMALGAAGERKGWKKPIKALGGLGSAAVDHPIRFLLETGALVGAGYGIKKLVDALRKRYNERKKLDTPKNS